MVTDFQVLANDVDITKKIKSLGSYNINITDNIGDQADSFSMRISDANSELVFPQNNTKLQVYVGYKDTLHDFGYFYITDVKYSYSKGQGAFIDVVASSVPFTETDIYKSMQTSYERSFSNTTVSAVVNTIAQEHNLTADINPTIGAKVVNSISQHNESNIGFLYRFIREYGGVLKPTHSRLLVLADDKGTNVSGATLDTVSIDISDCNNITYNSKKSSKYNSVQADYQSTDTAKIKTVTVGSGDPVLKLSYIYESEELAQTAASKVLNKSNLNNDTLNLDMTGNPELIAGAPISITGLREDIPQNWYIGTANHSLSKSGYSTSLQLTIRSQSTVSVASTTVDTDTINNDSSQNTNNAQQDNTGAGTITTNLSPTELKTINDMVQLWNDYGDWLQDWLDDLPNLY
ncbi:phage late control D family protein [Francisella philomiragia]|uniref:Uncharacterized protein n=1 Tax=Francisella philomiragia TaxID=28110 RepID=A0ABS1GDR8_9GAMM|nr:contractile injection system protein, VgrG/Pvc8 family [Francisella philomiragia]MBK2258973.1 hypothetical protein [Francisella philomiragia]MBK2302664.1 hypothetical protein [Francisella philomiragia]